MANTINLTRRQYFALRRAVKAAPRGIDRDSIDGRTRGSLLRRRLLGVKGDKLVAHNSAGFVVEAVRRLGEKLR